MIGLLARFSLLDLWRWVVDALISIFSDSFRDAPDDWNPLGVYHVSKGSLVLLNHG